MSFRERTSHQPNWDLDDDHGPPDWSDRPSLESNEAAEGATTADLPAWSVEPVEGVDSETAYPPLGRDNRRRPPSINERRTAAWPNLRDSLKGSATGTTSSTRTSRRSLTSEPPSRRRPDVGGQLPEPDLVVGDEASSPRFDDDRYIDDDRAYEQLRYPARRGYAVSTRQRARRAGTAPPRPALQLPPMVGALVASQDRSVLVALGGAAFSVLIMVATLSSRTDALPTWIPIHLDAAGNPDRWGTASTLWRIPLMTAMLTLASVVAAIFISRRDPFAARCLIAGSLLVHVLAWIGLVTILW